MNRYLSRAMVLVAIMLSLTTVSRASEKRPLTPQDIVRLEGLSAATISPDGRWLAYVKRRPKTVNARPYWHDIDRSDIWLVATDGGTPRALTDGVTNETGYWEPTWSPDSKRLAMFAQHHDATRVFVWDIDTSKLRHVTDRLIGSGEKRGHILLSWLSDRSLVTTILPAGATSEQLGDASAMRLTMAARSHVFEKPGPAVSVLESGIPVDLTKRPQVDLVRLDLDGHMQRLGSAAAFEDFRLSPDHRLVAFLTQSDVALPTPGPLGPDALDDNRIYGLHVSDTDGRLVSVDSDLTNHVTSGSVRWSRDAREIAFVRQNADNGRARLQIVRCQLQAWQCTASFPGYQIEPRHDGSLPVPALQWAADGHLLVQTRTEWWIVPRSGEPRKMTTGTSGVPGELFIEPEGKTAVGLAGGRLWRFWVNADRQPESIAAGVSSIAWPNTFGGWYGDLAQNVSHLVVAKDGADFVRVDLASGQMTKVAPRVPNARLADFSLVNDTTATIGSNDAGTRLSLSRSHGQPAMVAEVNTFLKDIARGPVRKIEYHSQTGQTLTGWILLPVDYQEGKRYPLITKPYPHQVFGGQAPPSDLLDVDYSLTMALLAARGYAVLEPSVPLKGDAGDVTDPLLELANGVLPAVDKAIEIGIADPTRLGIMGVSYGGFATYALVGQTNRFRAAIALAGISNLVSNYGIFHTQFVYSDAPQEVVFQMVWTERGQGRMVNPPWKDMDRYVRNSPLTYAGQVETPLMIIQGDLDPVPIQQGEEFFTALYRQHKRAQFVRYWGEGHGIQDPANVCDMWDRMYAWFDDQLDISRDPQGHLLWEATTVKPRGAHALR